MAATEYCPDTYISWATCALWAVTTEGRPPWRPRARAAASPAAVRSRIRSRSNSAPAAKPWKTSLPPGVVVSIASWRLRNPTPHSARPVMVSTYRVLGVGLTLGSRRVACVARWCAGGWS